MLEFLSKYWCGFHKSYNTQYCLLPILVKWKSLVDKGKSFEALLTNLYVRSSHRRCSVRKGVLRKFAKFTGKHLWQSLFLNKVTGLQLY